MLNKDFEHKLQKNSLQCVYQETLGEYLLLLLSTVEDEAGQRNSLRLEVNSEILDIKQAIRSYIVNIEELLDGEEEKKLQAFKECSELKTKLLKKYETVYAYFLLWSMYSMTISDEILMRKYKDQDLKDRDVEFDLFIQDCVDYLVKSEDFQDEQNRIGNILQYIPIKMGRDKYFDMVKKSLNYAFADESEAYIAFSIKAFSSFCAPELSENYGKFFTEIAKWLDEKKEFLPSKLSDEALDSEFEEFQQEYSLLQDIEDYFLSIYNDINALILLFSQSFTFEELTENDISYSDIYHAITEIINKEVHDNEKEVMLVTALESLDKLIEPVIDNVNELREKSTALKGKITKFDALSEDCQKMLLVEEFADKCYFGQLNEDFLRFDTSNDSPIADEYYKNKMIDDFLIKTRNYFVKLPIHLRRIAMSQLLSALPQSITASELHSMLEEALDTAASLEARLLIVDKIGSIFEDCSFEGAYNYDEDYDDHCDCGHDHCHH